MIFAEQAADLAFEFCYLAIPFVDGGRELIVGAGEAIQSYESVVEVLLKLSFFVGYFRDLSLLLGLNLLLFVVVPEQVTPCPEEAGGQQTDDQILVILFRRLTLGSC